VTIQGPLPVPEGYNAFIFRQPIFIPNVSDPNEAFGCAHGRPIVR
jgi:hypothetical protein